MNNIQILRPFGPSIVKLSMPEDLIKKLNDYVDRTVLDNEKLSQLDHSNQLAGKVKQEFLLENQFMQDTYPEALGRVNHANKIIEYQFSEDAGPMSHPVQPDSYIEINNFYTATVYNKGAEVVRILQTLIGKPAFFAGSSIQILRQRPG